MIKGYDIHRFFENYASKKSFSTLSENKESNDPLVDNDTPAYDYEECVKRFFDSNALRMVDATFITNDNRVYFIEFKGGFRVNIRLDNFNLEKWYCSDADKVCRQAATIFMENQDHKIDELISSVNGKLVETYITLHNFILPLCEASDKNFHTSYIVVVDEDSHPLGAIEETLNSLSGKGANTINPVSNLRNAIGKYRIVNHNSEPIFFDCIEVLNTYQFNLRFPCE